MFSRARDLGTSSPNATSKDGKILQTPFVQNSFDVQLLFVQIWVQFLLQLIIIVRMPVHFVKSYKRLVTLCIARVMNTMERV